MTRDIDRERAKTIIVEIIRRSGGSLKNKTNLFKAFWKAHVVAAEQGRTLSHYPIVRMPNGPGIDRFDVLLGQLLSAGVVQTETESGKYPSIIFMIADDTQFLSDLSGEDIEAVNAGVHFVNGRSAATVSQWSHELSRSWKLSKDGQELDIVLDAIPETASQGREESRRKIRDIVASAFNEST